jgi:hypothetical protein
MGLVSSLPLSLHLPCIPLSDKGVMKIGVYCETAGHDDPTVTELQTTAINTLSTLVDCSPEKTWSFLDKETKTKWNSPESGFSVLMYMPKCNTSDYQSYLLLDLSFRSVLEGGIMIAITEKEGDFGSRSIEWKARDAKFQTELEYIGTHETSIGTVFALDYYRKKVVEVVSKKRRMDDDDDLPLPPKRKVQFSAPEDPMEEAVRRPRVAMDKSMHSYIDSDLSNLLQYI